MAALLEVTASAPDQAAARAHEAQFLGHPRGLAAVIVTCGAALILLLRSSLLRHLRPGPPARG